MPENFIESLYQNSEQSVLSHQITRFECVVHIYGREYCRTPNNRQIRGIHQIVLFVGVNSAKKKRDKLLKMFYSRYLIRKLKFTYRTKCFSRYLSVSRGKVLIAFNSLRIWTRLSSFSVKQRQRWLLHLKSTDFYLISGHIPKSFGRCLTMSLGMSSVFNSRKNCLSAPVIVWTSSSLSDTYFVPLRSFDSFIYENMFNRG